jgi:hypothetical protein
METKLTELESLKIIHEMIATSKNRLKNNSFFYLLWGWLVLIASISHYVLLRIHVDHHYAYLLWPILMMAGAIVSVIAGIRIGKREKVISHIDKMIMLLWWGFCFTLLVVLVMASFQKLSWSSTYAFIIALYGLGTFVSGGILKFKPLIIGGIISWIMSVLALFVEPINILLVMALSIVIAYLIPGYMLKFKEK